MPQFIARLDAFAAVYESTSVAIDGNHPPPNADQVEALAESRCLRLLLAGAHQAYAAWGAAAKIRRLEADHPFLRGSRLAPAYSAATTVV